jgi:hypothetical protein
MDWKQTTSFLSNVEYLDSVEWQLCPLNLLLEVTTDMGVRGVGGKGENHSLDHM